MNRGKNSGRLGLGTRKVRWRSSPDSGTLGLWPEKIHRRTLNFNFSVSKMTQAAANPVQCDSPTLSVTFWGYPESSFFSYLVFLLIIIILKTISNVYSLQI